MNQLISSLSALWFVLMLVAVLTFGMAWPLMAFSATRNVKKIRLQLERLNDNLEAGRIVAQSPRDTARDNETLAAVRAGAGIGSLR